MTTSPRISRLFEGPFYTEGPACDHAGDIYFTTLAGGQVLRLEKGGGAARWADSSCPNGQAVLRSGTHLICNSRSGLLERYSAEGAYLGPGSRPVIAGVPVSCPNDVIEDSHGNIYFTDSVRYHGMVFFLGAGGDAAIVARDLDYPNGLALAPDEKTLFVAESYQNRILAFALSAPGAAGPLRVFCGLPRHPSGEETRNLPDGLAMDGEGCLWVAHYGMGAVHRLSAEGILQLSIPTGIPLTSNVIVVNAGTLIVTGGFAEPGPGAVVKIAWGGKTP